MIFTDYGIRSALHFIQSESVKSGNNRYIIAARALYWRLFYGIGIQYFLMAGMARPEFDPKDIKMHISDREFKNALDVLNPPLYRKISQHKLIEKSMLATMHIPSSPLIGYYHEIEGCSQLSNFPTNRQELNDLLLSYEGQRLCFKLIEGWGGRGFIAGDIINRGGQVSLCPLFSDQELTVDEILLKYQSDGHSCEFIIEEYTQQHEDFALFNPSSLNSVRTWVLDDGDSCEVIGAYLRVGRMGSLTDNGDSGGIMFPITIEDGTIRPGILCSNPIREELLAHPDSDNIIAGTILPFWEQIKAFSCDTLRRLPKTWFTGLDVSMSSAGPILIESNPNPDRFGAAFANIPSRKLVIAAQKIAARD